MPTNLLLDFDKAGAEWVVVAYVSGDENMLAVVESGESPHVATGHLITGAPKDLIILEDKLLDKTTDPDILLSVRETTPELHPLLKLPFLPRSMTIRQGGKKSNHGLNYGMKYRRFALENEIPETEAEDIVNLYTTIAYPRIPEYWEATKAQLKKNRTLTNCFGRKVRLMGEWGVELFDKAYSFVPQSTVGDTVNRAIRAAYEDATPIFRDADLLSQKHDSATYQYPIEYMHSEGLGVSNMAEFAIKFGLHYMNPELEYGGRKFHIGTDLKVGFDMGNLVKIKLTDDTTHVSEQLAKALEDLRSRETSMQTPAVDTAVLDQSELDQVLAAVSEVRASVAAEID